MTKLEILKALVDVIAAQDAEAPMLNVGAFYDLGHGTTVQVRSRDYGQVYTTDWHFSSGRRGMTRIVRIAVDGSWRCANTLLPLNYRGETFE